jgi:hypothetical protein
MGEEAAAADAVQSCAALCDKTGDEERGSESGLQVLGDDDGSDVGSQLKKPTDQLVIGRKIHLNTEET